MYQLSFSFRPHVPAFFQLSSRLVSFPSAFVHMYELSSNFPHVSEAFFYHVFSFPPAFLNLPQLSRTFLTSVRFYVARRHPDFDSPLKLHAYEAFLERK
jgi:hypothetical protein